MEYCVHKCVSSNIWMRQYSKIWMGSPSFTHGTSNTFKFTISSNSTPLVYRQPEAHWRASYLCFELSFLFSLYLLLCKIHLPCFYAKQLMCFKFHINEMARYHFQEQTHMLMNTTSHVSWSTIFKYLHKKKGGNHLGWTHLLSARTFMTR